MIIDTHFHAFPARFFDLMPEARNATGGREIAAFDHQEYLNVMDRYGIDIGILSNTAGRLEQGGNRQRALQGCRILNDSFADAHARSPHRFKAFARLPMVHMDDCLQELARCFGELGMHGVILPTNVAGSYLDEPQFTPFWEEMSKVGKPVFLHPTNAPCESNWDSYSLHLKILWPTDSTLAIARIVYSGICDRHPTLNLIGSHLGGMILNYPDRLNWREGDVPCKEEPEAYFRRIYYDTAGPVRAPFIKMACDTVGVDQILFGADYPHGHGGRADEFYPMTLRAMEELSLSAVDKEKIYYRNAKRLFGFEEG